MVTVSPASGYRPRATDIRARRFAALLRGFATTPPPGEKGTMIRTGFDG